MLAEDPIIKRHLWGALNPKWQVPITPPLKYVYFGVTGSEPCLNYEECVRRIQAVQRFHMIACPDIRFNFVIGGDLRIYEGRGWDYQPGLSNDYRRLIPKSLYIGYIGNFRKEPDQAPRYDVTPEMISLANSLVLLALENGILDKYFIKEDLF
ncbi:peptidoglycan-recognition protein SC1a/b-like [Macrosteles quadrilineatus]|uniref:peptidoglycan-recognition protein SC1a/b-like n=1 Tax=Macrosteles quadrilineatus TaxID=74068 RepID=UPI0023E2B253|nr:peptidoglycan-recognition protein SC1a/b-like [Macrosteles quadrilineatus]